MQPGEPDFMFNSLNMSFFLFWLYAIFLNVRNYSESPTTLFTCDVSPWCNHQAPTPDHRNNPPFNSNRTLLFPPVFLEFFSSSL
jgi:hypothetical protein